jgi:DNA-binding response OmpR family regulator
VSAFNCLIASQSIWSNGYCASFHHVISWYRWVLSREDNSVTAERILIVEDEEAIAAFLQTALEQDGFAVQVVGEAKAALSQIRREPPGLILLDLMLPGMSGLELCREVRRREPYVPIIMLTAKSDDVDKIIGLEVGADDYITKPFNARELVARIRAVLRLARKAGATISRERLQVGQMIIDRAYHTVAIAGRHIELTPKEFDLLATLAWERGRVFGREMLLERVWGYDYMGESRTVDVHIQRLRHKIEPDATCPTYIMTVRGIGYKFAAEEEL